MSKMSTSDHQPAAGNPGRGEDSLQRQGNDHIRTDSTLSAPFSEYEFFQYTNTAPQPPSTPRAPSAPPQYAGAQSPVSSPQHGSNASNTGATPTATEAKPNNASYPEVVAQRNSSHGLVQYETTSENGEKEAHWAPKSNYQTTFDDPTSPRHDNREDPISTLHDDKPRKYLFGLSKKKFIIAIVLLVLLIIGIAVGVGVGVGLSGNDDKKPEPKPQEAPPPTNTTTKDPLYSMGGALDPAYYSTQGAFNGSGVALADVNFGIDNSLYVFYQKYTGEIEQLIYKADGTWNFVTTVATDAKNSTPLSTVAYIVDSVATWHLFYVSEDNILKQRTQSNESSFQTNIWEDGRINDLKLEVNDADSVGMQACYFGNFYGSLVDYNDAAFGSSNATATTGMNVWYAATDSTFEQYDWTNGQDQWTHTRSWENMNTHAGIGCQSWLTNTTSYVFMVDNTNTFGIWWKDIDTNKTSTDSHPINNYTKAENINIPNIHPSSSLGYTDFAIYQDNENTIYGVNITWAAEDTAIAPAKQSTSDAATSDSSSQDRWALEPQDAGLGGTHMAITGSQPISGGRQEFLFYQAEGDDLRLGKRDASGGDFAFIDVPLNNLD